jgi:hypothetical protein
MRECVLDASVVLDWFSAAQGTSTGGSRRLRLEFEAGDLEVIGPPLIHLEILNVAGRRWGWGADALLELAEALRGAVAHRRSNDPRESPSSPGRSSVSYSV